MSDKDLFQEDLKKVLDAKATLKMILSKPRPGKNFRSTSIETVVFKKLNVLKVLEKSATQHFTSTLTYDKALNWVMGQMNENYYFCELLSENLNGTLLQNDKGTTTYIKKKRNNVVEAGSLEKSKAYLIPEDCAFLVQLGISSSKGKVYEHSQKKFRQINKFIEIIEALLRQPKQEMRIADMGCGKAYLTFALYHYLKNVKGMNPYITGYEIRADLVDECNAVAAGLEFQNLKFEMANIEEIVLGPCDMIVSLHACDIATDMAIYAGLKAKAKYMVLAPCCHKQIRKQIELKNGILKHGILLERQAEIITDAIRALILEDHGYKTKVFEFISAEHTSKNTMIIASKYKRNENAALEIRDIKETYSLQYHYLEKLVERRY